MQYKSETEKAATMGTQYVSVPHATSPASDPQIRRTRKILIIILGVFLGLCVITLISAIFGSEVHLQNEKAQRGSKIGGALLSILFYSFGIFSAYRYSTLSLRIFAWLGVISVVLTGIVIIVFIFSAIFILNGVSNLQQAEGNSLLIGGTLVLLFVICLCVAAVILSIIIIKFAFKLARLIDANKNVVTQQI